MFWLKCYYHRRRRQNCPRVKFTLNLSSSQLTCHCCYLVMVNLHLVCIPNGKFLYLSLKSFRLHSNAKNYFRQEMKNSQCDLKCDLNLLTCDWMWRCQRAREQRDGEKREHRRRDDVRHLEILCWRRLR